MASHWRDCEAREARSAHGGRPCCRHLQGQ